MIGRKLLAIVAVFTLVGVGAIARAVPQAALTPVPWTLAAAVKEALAQSPDAKLAAEHLAAAKAVLTQAAASDWPRLALKSSYMQTDNPMTAFGAILGQRAFSPTINFNDPGQVDDFNLAAVASYNIYSGGRASANKAAARAGVEATARDREAVLMQLETEVARAFFQIQQVRADVRALEAAVKSYEEAWRVAALRYQSGQMLKSELLNIEAQLAQSREQLLGGRHNEALAEKQFLFLLGHDGGESVVLAPDSTQDESGAIAAPSDNLSIERRPELQAMRSRIAAAENTVRAARGGLRPTVNAFASYQYDQGWRLNGDSRSWTAGVQAEIPIFDGQQTRGRIGEAEAQEAQARAGLRKLELALALELDQARLAYNLAREQVAASETLVAQAEASAGASRERFTAGALLSTELIGVESRLTEARMRQAMALAAEKIAAVALRRAAGLPLFTK
ncbi:MAG: TolC family protein [Desulfobulbaceae bacterium]|nr:TolC family protein [Desulfobulbaceae bacterium]